MQGLSCHCGADISFFVQLRFKSEVILDISLADISRCSSVECLNGGSCVDGEEDSYWCRCPLGYSGTLCENGKRHGSQEESTDLNGVGFV